MSKIKISKDKNHNNEQKSGLNQYESNQERNDRNYNNLQDNDMTNQNKSNFTDTKNGILNGSQNQINRNDLQNMPDEDYSDQEDHSKDSNNNSDNRYFIQQDNKDLLDHGSSFAPRIGVIGIGGAGGNAVNTMIKDMETFETVKFIVANTDHQVLKYFPHNVVIQLGPNCTRGLGAGADPGVGRKAAEESEEEIRSALKGIDMVFIASGMGGGTGTGAAPFVADIAKKMGILTVAVVTIPFSFEGMKRNKTAQNGITELKEKADCVVVVPNDKLLNIINNRTPLADAFKMADDVLYNAVKCVVELIMKPGLINLDFADIRTVMSNMRTAFLSIGKASGDDRALRAAEIAINNPLSNVSLTGATSLLINISGGNDLTLHEINVAVARILEERGGNTIDANILVGATFNEKMNDEISVYTIATGIHDDLDTTKEDSRKNKVFGDSLENLVSKNIDQNKNNNDGLKSAQDISKNNSDIRSDSLKTPFSTKDPFSSKEKTSYTGHDIGGQYNQKQDHFKPEVKFGHATTEPKQDYSKFTTETHHGYRTDRAFGVSFRPSGHDQKHENNFSNQDDYLRGSGYAKSDNQIKDDFDKRNDKFNSRQDLNQIQDKPSFLKYRINTKDTDY